MMASEVTTMTRKSRKFSKEFKLETVKLVKEGPRSIGEVARDLDLTESAVRNWVRQFDVDAGVREGVSTGELEELRRLRVRRSRPVQAASVRSSPQRPHASTLSTLTYSRVRVLAQRSPFAPSACG